MTEPSSRGDIPAAAPAVHSPPGLSVSQRLGPYITVPGQLLVDEPSGIVISGCPPGEVVTVAASAQIDGFVHEATAVFTADGIGSVDTARQAAAAGSYTGTDPFGLWWSATPAEPAAGTAPAALIACRVTAETVGQVATAEFQRHWLAPGAVITEVREPGISGLFARPAGPGPFPGVVAFGGSAGGLVPSAAWAPVLASRGLATLAIAYFGAPGLPSTLTGIEVEVVERAADWLLGRSDVAAGKVAVLGHSRGSELALWAGALLDSVGAVVAFAPSGISWAGLDAGGPADAPAWVFRGRPLPYAPIGAAAKAAAAPAQGPVALRAAFEPALADPASFTHAVIPVETTRGPILFVSGEADAMWPATPMTEIAEQRARDHDFGHRLIHLRYPDAGHLSGGIPGTPVATQTPPNPLTRLRYSLGGTPAGNARARADSWPRVVAFLHDALTADKRGGI